MVCYNFHVGSNIEDGAFSLCCLSINIGIQQQGDELQVSLFSALLWLLQGAVDTFFTRAGTFPEAVMQIYRIYCQKPSSSDEICPEGEYPPIRERQRGRKAGLFRQKAPNKSEKLPHFCEKVGEFLLPPVWRLRSDVEQAEKGGDGRINRRCDRCNVREAADIRGTLRSPSRERPSNGGDRWATGSR